MSYPLPPNTRAVGTVDPPGDMNKVINALTGMGEPGYIKPSGDTSGATDTAAVAAAEALGGNVYFGPATYWGNFTKQAGTVWQGSGRNQTILKAPAASNADVVQGASFTTLTCTGSLGGIGGWAIRDLTIDGNKAAQTTGGNGLRVYGYDYDLSNVSIRNAFAEGLYTEWNASGAPAGIDSSMEARVYGLKIFGCGATGWHDRGPHDSRGWDVTIYGNGSGFPCYWAEGTPGGLVTAGSSGVAVSTFAGAGTLNVSSTISWPAAGSISGTQGAIVVTGLTGGTGTATITYTGTTATTFTGCTTVSGSGTLATNNPLAMTGGGYSAGGMLLTGAHTFGSAASYGYLLDTAVYLTGCVAEVAATGMVLIRGLGCKITGGAYFVTAGATQTGCGIQVGDTVNGPTLCQVRTSVSRLACTSAATAALNIVNDATQNDIEIAAWAPAGTVVWSGARATGSRYAVYASGQTTTLNAANSMVWDSTVRKHFIPDNTAQAYTVQDPVGFVDAFGVSTTTGSPRFEIPNGYELRGYSDAYTTATIRASTALGHIGTAVKNGTSMSVAAGASNGGSPPAPTLLSASSDTQGQVSIGSGTSAAAGAQAVVTFANAFTAAPIVVITAANAATSALQPYVTTVGTGAFTVAFNVAPTSSQATGTYLVNYVVLARPN